MSRPKGSKLSNEHKEKIRKAKLGKKQTIEWIQKRVSKIIGRKHSEETKQKISLGNKNKPSSMGMLGKQHSDAALEKMKNAKIGKHCAEETKIKLSNIGKERRHSEETKKKIGDGNRGKIMSQEAREKIRLFRLGKSLTEKQQEHLNLLHTSPAMLGKKHSNETKAKLRDAGKRRRHSEETKEKMRNTRKLLMQNEDYRRQSIRYLSRIQSPTFIENKLFTWMCVVFPTEDIYRNYHIGRYYPDFAIPALMLAFEADGDYWHNRPGDQEHDIQKDLWLNSQGWIVHRFKGKEIISW